MKLIKKVRSYIKDKKKEEEYKKKIAELKKRDPFTYKNF